MYHANKNLKGYPLSLVLVVIGLYFLICFTQGYILDLWVHIISIPVIVLCFVLLNRFSVGTYVSKKLMVISLKNMLKSEENRDRMLGIISFSLNESEIIYEKDGNKNINPWRNLNFEENENYIFLNKTTLGGYAIAKKKIMPEEKREEAIVFIKEKFVEE